MIAAIVFSRDRAMQLDLLLTSLERNGAEFFGPVHVLWKGTLPEFREAYKTCAREHPKVWLVPESDLVAQTRYLLHAAEFATFLTDDSVLYRLLPFPPFPLTASLCFSLRLGLNTCWCYPHSREQRVPRLSQKSGLSWKWASGDGDFGYPGSLDGHVFRGEILRGVLAAAPDQANPNRIEEHLVSTLAKREPREPFMDAYQESCLVGIPVNRVNATTPNRNGEVYSYDVAELNRRYLAGERIDLSALDFSDVRGAHQEIELRFV
jgi:hypothetical protein